MICAIIGYDTQVAYRNDENNISVNAKESEEDASDDDFASDNPLVKLFQILLACVRKLGEISDYPKLEMDGKLITESQFNVNKSLTRRKSTTKKPPIFIRENSTKANQVDFHVPTDSSKLELEYCLRYFEFVNDLEKDVKNLNTDFLNNSVFVLDRIIRQLERETFQRMQSVYNYFIDSDYYTQMVAESRCKRAESVNDYLCSEAFLDSVIKKTIISWTEASGSTFLHYRYTVQYDTTV